MIAALWLFLGATLAAIHFDSTLVGCSLICLGCALLHAHNHQAIKTRNLLREIQRELRKDRR